MVRCAVEGLDHRGLADKEKYANSLMVGSEMPRIVQERSQSVKWASFVVLFKIT